MTAVAIFWDYENCRPAGNTSGYELVNKVRRAVQSFGNVSLFKAYLDVPLESSNPRSTIFHSELQSSGVTLAYCPHNGKKDVADKMILVDMLAYAIDRPAPATIVLISGDRDFAYGISILRLRGYDVVAIVPPQVHSSITAQATSVLNWQDDVVALSVDESKPAISRQRSYSLLSSKWSPPKASFGSWRPQASRSGSLDMKIPKTLSTLRTDDSVADIPASQRDPGTTAQATSNPGGPDANGTSETQGSSSNSVSPPHKESSDALRNLTTFTELIQSFAGESGRSVVISTLSALLESLRKVDGSAHPDVSTSENVVNTSLSAESQVKDQPEISNANDTLDWAEAEPTAPVGGPAGQTIVELLANLTYPPAEVKDESETPQLVAPQPEPNVKLGWTFDEHPRCDGNSCDVVQVSQPGSPQTRSSWRLALPTALRASAQPFTPVFASRDPPNTEGYPIDSPSSEDIDIFQENDDGNSVSSSSHASPEEITLPAGTFVDLMCVLLSFHKQGTPRPRWSQVGQELLQIDSMAYERAGVSQLKKYIELAQHANVVIIGGSNTPNKEWVKLKPAFAFTPLVTVLESHWERRMLRSLLGERLPMEFPLAYLKAGVQSLGEYLAMAEKENVVKLGNGPIQGREWVELRRS